MTMVEHLNYGRVYRYINNKYVKMLSFRRIIIWTWYDSWDKHKVDREIICHQKQKQIIKDNIRKNIKRVDHNYKVRDKVMLNSHAT